MSSRKLDATTKPLRVIGAFFCFTFGGARPPASRFGYLALGFPVHQPVHRSPATRNEVGSLGEGGCFPVQQTASLSGAGTVFGLSLFLKNCPRRQFFRWKTSARFLHTFTTENEWQSSHTSGNQTDRQRRIPRPRENPPQARLDICFIQSLPGSSCPVARCPGRAGSRRRQKGEARINLR